MIVLSVNKHSLNVCLKKYAILMQLYVEVWGGEFFFEEIREASKSKPNLKKKTLMGNHLIRKNFSKWWTFLKDLGKKSLHPKMS